MSIYHGEKLNIPTADEGDKILLARAIELWQKSDGAPLASPFLTPREQRFVFEALTQNGMTAKLFFWGGYLGAERRRAIFLPDWLTPDVNCSCGVFDLGREQFFLGHLESLGSLDLSFQFTCPLALSGSGYRELSHRDWLGSLMGLGIKREVLGDIAICDSRNAYTFADPKACDFILEEFKKAGRDTVSAKKLENCAAIEIPKRKYENINTTIASPRLDCVIKALCSLSRESAQELITEALAELNYYIEKNTDRTVTPGDIITVRGYGKFIIDNCEEPTKKGRIRLAARKYA